MSVIEKMYDFKHYVDKKADKFLKAAQEAAKLYCNTVGQKWKGKPKLFKISNYELLRAFGFTDGKQHEQLFYSIATLTYQNQEYSLWVSYVLGYGLHFYRFCKREKGGLFGMSFKDTEVTDKKMIFELKNAVKRIFDDIDFTCNDLLFYYEINDTEEYREHMVDPISVFFERGYFDIKYMNIVEEGILFSNPRYIPFYLTKLFMLEDVDDEYNTFSTYTIKGKFEVNGRKHIVAEVLESTDDDEVGSRRILKEDEILPFLKGFRCLESENERELLILLNDGKINLLEYF